MVWQALLNPVNGIQAKGWVEGISFNSFSSTPWFDLTIRKFGAWWLPGCVAIVLTSQI